jgi:predicted transcriptional regulator
MAMTLRLTDEQDAKLTQIAEKRQISKQRAIEALIEEANEREFVKVRLQEAFEKVMTRDKELMERLADA